MKKVLIIAAALIVGVSIYAFFVVFGALKVVNPSVVQAAALTPNTEYVVTPTFIPTQTPVPSATIGYEATLFIAQATADEARRINAQVTAQAEQNQVALVQLTADAENRNQQVLSWTQIAAPTTIPLTATQQAIYNTQSAQGQAIVVAMMTSTHEAPTAMAAMINAKESARFVALNNYVDIFGKFALGIFCIGVAVFCFRWRAPEKKEVPELEAQRETTVWVKKHENHGASREKFTVPCSPEQLTELAQHITQGTRTLAINNWEGAGTLFTRPVIHQMRGWLQDNKYAVSTGDGQLAPTNDGLIFLCGWLESQQLPTEYDFAEVEQERELA